LRVTGDRVWKGGAMGGYTKPELFTTMPLVYERAFGGVRYRNGRPVSWNSCNPVGAGLSPTGSHEEGERLPNVENPDCLLSSGSRALSPAGFGPIARDWSPRREYAGTYDETWLAERYPLLPLDFDERFNQYAPEDMQPRSFLTGGERVELENLCADGLM